MYILEILVLKSLLIHYKAILIFIKSFKSSIHPLLAYLLLP
jgi:hypothetical protein